MAGITLNLLNFVLAMATMLESGQLLSDLNVPSSELTNLSFVLYPPINEKDKIEIRFVFDITKDYPILPMCNSFILCYVSFLNTRNSQVRPHLRTESRHNSNVSRDCQAAIAGNGNGKRLPIWHGIKLRVCRNASTEFGSMSEIRLHSTLVTSFWARCYGPVVYTVKWQSYPVALFSIEFSRGSESFTSPMALPTGKFCFWNTNGGKTCPIDMGQMEDWKWPYKYGSKMLTRKGAGFWLLPLDMQWVDGQALTLQMIHPKQFSIESYKTDVGNVQVFLISGIKREN